MVRAMTAHLAVPAQVHWTPCVYALVRGKCLQLATAHTGRSCCGCSWAHHSHAAACKLQTCSWQRQCWKSGRE